MNSSLKAARQHGAKLFVIGILAASIPHPAKADALVEYLFWNEMGNQVGKAVSSYNDYKRERQLWQDNIAAAKRELEACGGCAAAKEKLAKWQGIENKFQDVAGSLAVAGGMPPNLAKALGINPSLVPPSTKRQIEESCGIRRGAWVDELSPSCQTAVDKHLACIRTVQNERGFCDWKGSSKIGRQCYDTSKLRDHCARGNMDAFEMEKALQASRAAGAIIPEYEGGPSPVVYYGRVPDDYTPDLPPRATILERLNDGEVSRASFLMNKTTKGRLNEIMYARFWHDDIDPFTRCFALDRPTDEMGRRVCDDLRDLQTWYREQALLICAYAGQPLENVPPYIYWYGDRPDRAKPETLLSRSHSHPVLRVAGIRTECPVNRTTADQANQDWQTALSALSVQTPQTPADVRMNRPDWLQKKIDEQRVIHEAIYQRVQEARAAMAGFPLEGSYELRSKVEGKTKRADCTILRAKVSINYNVRCLSQGKAESVVAVAAGGTLLVMNNAPNSSLKGEFIVDLTKKERDGSDALTSEKRGTAEQTVLTRTGDLTPIESFPMVGRYYLEVSNDKVRLTGDCTVVLDNFYNPPRFDTECKTDDGRTYRSESFLPIEGSAALQISGWFPSRYMLDDRAVNNLHFRVSDSFDPARPDTAILVGSADKGVTAIMERIGDLSGPPPSLTVNRTAAKSQTSIVQPTTPKNKTNTKLPENTKYGAPSGVITLVKGGTSAGKDAGKASVINLETLETGGVRIQFKAGGNPGLARPEKACLRTRDGSVKHQPIAVQLKQDKPGRYFGTMDFAALPPGEWFFQYGCTDDFSMALIAQTPNS